MTKWSVETLNERVDEELTALPLEMRGRLSRRPKKRLTELCKLQANALRTLD